MVCLHSSSDNELGLHEPGWSSTGSVHSPLVCLHSSSDNVSGSHDPAIHSPFFSLHWVSDKLLSGSHDPAIQYTALLQLLSLISERFIVIPFNLHDAGVVLDDVNVGVPLQSSSFSISGAFKHPSSSPHVPLLQSDSFSTSIT